MKKKYLKIKKRLSIIGILTIYVFTYFIFFFELVNNDSLITYNINKFSYLDNLFVGSLFFLISSFFFRFKVGYLLYKIYKKI